MLCGKCKRDLHSTAFSPSIAKRGRNGGYCRSCKKEYNLTRKIENAEASKRYRDNNKEKVKKSKKLYIQKNKDRVSGLVRDSAKRARENLASAYIKRLLTMRGKLKSEDIPEILVDLARVNLMIKRAIKNKV